MLWDLFFYQHDEHTNCFCIQALFWTERTTWNPTIFVSNNTIVIPDMTFLETRLAFINQEDFKHANIIFLSRF